jgi:hypothetical protein
VKRRSPAYVSRYRLANRCVPLPARRHCIAYSRRPSGNAADYILATPGRNSETQSAGVLPALQDFAVKWVRAIPERYHQLENGVVSRIRIQEANSIE